MSRGASGRMVVEIEPELKRLFYIELAKDGLTFKDWLIRQAEQYIEDRGQPVLFPPEPKRPGEDPRKH